MPILTGSKKALRSSLRKAVINRRIKSQVKTAIDSYKAQPTQANLAEAMSTIDKAVKGHIFHRNKGARLKGQLSKLLPKNEVGKKLIKKAAARPVKKHAKTAKSTKKAAPKKAVKSVKPKAAKKTAVKSTAKKSPAKKKTAKK